MSGNTTTSAVSDREASASKEGMSLEEKIGMAKKFDREMKDYAKATVKEFLGIYGYEEDVDINIDESESHKTGETSTSQAVDKQTETEPTTSTDYEGDKRQLEPTTPIEATVVTVDFESYDGNEVSGVLIGTKEETLSMESGRSEERMGTVQPQRNEMLRLQETSKCTEGLHVSQSMNEQTGLQDQQGTSRVTQSECGRVNTDTGCISSQDLGTSHKTFETRRLQSESKDYVPDSDSGKSSRTSESNAAVLISAQTSDETSLHSAQERLLSSRAEEPGQTEKTHVLVDGKYLMPVSAPESAPTAADILDALSRIMPRAEQSTVEPALLEDHCYATTCGTASDLPQPAPSSPSDSTAGSSKNEAITSSRANKTAPEDLTVDGPVLHLRSAMLPLPLVNLPDARGQSEKVECHPGGVSDNLPPSISPNRRFSQITNQPFSNSNTELTVKQPLRCPSLGNTNPVTVFSLNIEDSSVYEPDGVFPKHSSENQSLRSLGKSTNPFNINLTTTSTTVTISSCTTSTLEAVQSKRPCPEASGRSKNTAAGISVPTISHTVTVASSTFEGPSASPGDVTDVSEKNNGREGKAKKQRADETPERREERLRAQRERARLRRSKENDEERAARREKDRKRQQLKRAREKGKVNGDLVDPPLKTTTDRMSREDEGLLASIHEVLEAGETEVQCSSGKPDEVIPRSTEIISKILQDLEPAVSNCSPEGEKVTDRLQFSSGESERGRSDLCQIGDRGGGKGTCGSVLLPRGVITEDIGGQGGSEPVILPEVTEHITVRTMESTSEPLKDKHVTPGETATARVTRNHSDMSSLPGNRKEFDIREKINFLNDQMLSDLAECTASQNGTSYHEEGKSPPEASSQTSKHYPKEHNDTHRTSQPRIALNETIFLTKQKNSFPWQEQPDPPAVTTSSTVPEGRPSVHRATKTSSPGVPQIITRSRKSKPNQPQGQINLLDVASSSSSSEGYLGLQRETTTCKISRLGNRPIETRSRKAKGGHRKKKHGLPESPTCSSLLEDYPDSLMEATEVSRKEKNRQNVRKKRAMETSDQQDTRLKEQRERVRKRRANETDAERETRRLRDRIRHQVKRTSESEETRGRRLTQQRDAARRRRSFESPEETVVRRIKDRDRARRGRELKRAESAVEW